MLSVTSVDIGLNSHLRVNGTMGLRSLGDACFCGVCGSVSGVGGYNEEPNRTRWTKNGMIKINGGSNWIHFAMVPPPQALNNHMRLQECTTQNQLVKQYTTQN